MIPVIGQIDGTVTVYDERTLAHLTIEGEHDIDVPAIGLGESAESHLSVIGYDPSVYDMQVGAVDDHFHGGRLHRPVAHDRVQ